MSPLPSIRRALRASLGTVLLVAAYPVLGAVLARSGADHGLVSPDGRVDTLMVALTLALLGLRFVIFFVVGPVAVYRAVVRLLSASR